MKEVSEIAFLYGGSWLNFHLFLPQNELRILPQNELTIKHLETKHVSVSFLRMRLSLLHRKSSEKGFFLYITE